MKRIVSLLGLLVVMAVSCVEEQHIDVQVLTDDPVFYATMEDSDVAATRAYVNDQLRIRWDEGDHISIFNKNTSNREYAFQGQTGDNSGEFRKVPSESFFAGNPLDYVYAVYPYSESTNISDDGEIMLTLPAEQSYRGNSFGLGANTMIAVADDNDLMFKNLCGYLMLKLYGDDVAVSSISLKGNNNEPLAGKASVISSVDGDPSLSFDASATDEIILTFPTPVTLGTTAATATTFWLVVPPTTFESGITLTVTTDDDAVFEKRTTGSLAISRNTRSTMAALEVIPVPQVHYLTFTSEGTTTLSLANYGGNAPVLYYSTDTEEWTPWDYSELTFTAGQPLYLCGDNPGGINKSWISEGEGEYSNFIAGGSNFSISGSIMYLIDRLYKQTAIPCEHCFSDLFKGCTGLTAGPDLPATTLAPACYNHLYYGCTSLAVAPALPATTLAERCYQGLFRNCTSLTEAPELPATTLAYRCYRLMFRDCLGLTTAPVLPATTLEDGCYYQMFFGCENLMTAPELPATTLAPDCYREMFNYCTGLQTAPELPATTLAENCYYYMFYHCINLAMAPELPATTLAQGCYFGMFNRCLSLTTAPALPATTLAERCYMMMFSECLQLNHVECLATDVSAPGCTTGWLQVVSETGTFVKAAEMEEWSRDSSGIPEGWTVRNDDGSPYIDRKFLTFTSEGTTAIYLNNFRDNAPVLYYSFDMTSWTQWDYSELIFTSDLPLYICGDNPDGIGSRPDSGSVFLYSTFVAGGSNFSVSGDIMSLIDKNEDVTVIPSSYCFYQLFRNCTGLTSGPDLPATTLTPYCYSQMFQGCTSLTTAPELPATTLAEYCYGNLFSGCTSLAEAPELPATTLASRCYSSMFYGCTSLTNAPVLPVTTLADRCYYYMFSGCTSLTSAPVLPATTLTERCYYYMFKGCTSLATAPELPATTLSDYCYHSMFFDCTSLAKAPDLPATTLAVRCYQSMFKNCTSLTTAPDLPASVLVDYCYSSMFSGCSQLNYVKCLATDISADYCTTQWLDGVATTGTFVKGVGMNDWPQGISGIPEGWTVQENVLPEAVDLGLPSGIKWASFNLGASSPEEYGDYYAWGETEPYYSSLDPLTWKEGKEAGYDWASYKWCNGTSTTLTKYNNDSSYGSVDNKTVLDPEDDVAHVKLGGKWRMPTDEEWTELSTECTWTWTTQNGVNGRKVTGPNGKSIFLPAAGYRFRTGQGNAGSYGRYWSSSLYTDSPYDACGFYFGSAGDVRRYDYGRIYGLSVRPVYAE